VCVCVCVCVYRSECVGAPSAHAVPQVFGCSFGTHAKTQKVKKSSVLYNDLHTHTHTHEKDRTEEVEEEGWVGSGLANACVPTLTGDGTR